MNNSSNIRLWAVICVALSSAFSAFAPVVRASDDIVFADFEGPDYGAWKVEGDAFGSGPVSKSFPNQKPVTGFVGHGFVNSYHGGDRATGRLTSPEFKIERRYITFLIGGGGWEGKTCINLVMDEKIVRTATGPNVERGGSEELSLASWDVASFAGKTARIEIVDQATGAWGHINVDQIVFTDTPPRVEAAPQPVSTRPEEVLYNGIVLPSEWPPRITDPKSRSPREVPYLEHPPRVINIDVGRQLFVDDFLIEKTDLTRTFHHAERYEKNPILTPTTPLEIGDGSHPCATVFNDGVWFDPNDRTFKMWYHAGWFNGTGLATSKDGLNWERSSLDVVPGTNRVLPVEGHGHRDGSTIWLDPYTKLPAERFKMFLYERPAETFGGQVFTSPDGIHWSGPTRTSNVGDNTTIFYNPFRHKWVYSIRSTGLGRARSYRECDDLIAGARWKHEAVFWAGADDLDLPDPKIQMRTELYNLDATPYESLMLGVFGVMLGPQNKEAFAQKIPKTIDLELAYSRDGFHWSRPDRTPFLASTRKVGDWDRGYLHTAASICAVVGDKLYFYYGGWTGLKPSGEGDIYAGGGVGIAFLRRDGFASMDAGEQTGSLLTRPMRFSGKNLLVNLASQGELRAEVLDEAGQVIQPFSAEKCVAFRGDSTHQRITWQGTDDLAALSGKVIRFRFVLTKGSLYSFWVSPDDNGASHGYVAAGGPEFDGPMDTTGK